MLILEESAYSCDNLAPRAYSHPSQTSQRGQNTSIYYTLQSGLVRAQRCTLLAIL
jgi:hypothetical protein